MLWGTETLKFKVIMKIIKLFIAIYCLKVLIPKLSKQM